ncbi:MAG: two-component system, cell cycle response regulator DivK [Blastocatellia bacterium]|jgi:CheY-like chemotaxis protein|nr:two-component system, cell cycle response regulator DivK [Blastocatellia bacterium]
MARILIADDYDDNRELLRLMLEMAGHEIREARDGKECLDMALAQPPDILLVDLSMPILDGWNLLRQLRGDERTRGIPCVAVTAFPTGHEPDQIVDGFVDGFNAYLGKPFRLRELLSTVGRLLAEHPFVSS